MGPISAAVIRVVDLGIYDSAYVVYIGHCDILTPPHLTLALLKRWQQAALTNRRCCDMLYQHDKADEHHMWVASKYPLNAPARNNLVQFVAAMKVMI